MDHLELSPYMCVCVNARVVVYVYMVVYQSARCVKVTADLGSEQEKVTALSNTMAPLR